MSRMFDGCEKFNPDLSKWNTVNVLEMNQMFDECINMLDIHKC
jgi:surface protein